MRPALAVSAGAVHLADVRREGLRVQELDVVARVDLVDGDVRHLRVVPRAHVVFLLGGRASRIGQRHVVERVELRRLERSRRIHRRRRRRSHERRRLLDGCRIARRNRDDVL